MSVLQLTFPDVSGWTVEVGDMADGWPQPHYRQMNMDAFDVMGQCFSSPSQKEKLFSLVEFSVHSHLKETV